MIEKDPEIQLTILDIQKDKLDKLKDSLGKVKVLNTYEVNLSKAEEIE